MSFDFRLPNINAQTDSAKLAQMQSYMYQLVQQLNWALNNIESASNGDTSTIVKTGGFEEASSAEAVNTFNSIKALIIKSADIVQAYSDKIQHNLEGVYVAQSDFGTYTQAVLQELEITPTQIAQRYYSKQNIDTMLQNMEKENRAWIQTGLLDSENDIYGIEVGQRTTVDGQEVFNKYARFTAEGIYFYLPGSSDAVAYMTGQKLYITKAHITQEITLGQYRIDITNGIAFKWIGG